MSARTSWHLTGCLPALSILPGRFRYIRSKRFSHNFTGSVEIGLTSKRPGSNILSMANTFTELPVNSYELLSQRTFLKMMENFRQRMRSASHSYRPALSPPCKMLDHYSVVFLNFLPKFLTCKQHRTVRKEDKYR
jgi:hypothetical protein